MKILKLVLKNFRGAPDGAYSFAPRGTPLDLVLVTGRPRCGKTSLLEAIIAAKEAVGRYGAPLVPRQLLRHGVDSGDIQATWLLSEAEASWAGLQQREWITRYSFARTAGAATHERKLERIFSRYGHAASQAKFEYFPAGRQLPASWPPLPEAASELDEARIRLIADPDKYAEIYRTLADVALEDGLRTARLLGPAIAIARHEGDALSPFRDAIAAVAPHLRLQGVGTYDGELLFQFARRDGSVVELRELSGAERQAVIFGVTFRRIGLNNSVVLIDLPELHIHPEEQSRFCSAVATLGTGNQIIATTSSADVLRATSSEQIIEMEGRLDR